MKKKIAIVTRCMIMGGIEKSLISLLKAIPSNEYDVTIFVMAKGGELFDNIPEWIEVKNIYGEYSSIIQRLKKLTNQKNFSEALKFIYYTSLSRFYRRIDNIYKEEWNQLKIVPKINEGYDIAIAYHVPASLPVVYVLNNLNARKKIGWIHSDISVYKKEIKQYKDYYCKFDKIYCVSKFAKDKFIETFPRLENKTDVFYNIINKEELNYLSKEYTAFDDDFNGIRLLTVGRITEQKGQDLIPEIIKMLIKDNLNIRWYLIGDGEGKEQLQKEIKENNLEDRVVMLGTKMNPYPYFRECDIYVQPSRHEGYCITLAEARVFNKAIITTDFVGAKEQIIDGKTGLIVRFNKNDIYNAIKKLSKDDNLKHKIIKNLELTKENDNYIDSLNKLFKVNYI